MLNNAFYFILKALFVLKIFTFFHKFGYVGKWLDKKTRVIFKICDDTNWNTKNHNKHVASCLKK